MPGLWRLTPVVAFCLTSCQPVQEGGLKPPPPGIPAAISVSPQTATFASIDETQGFTAVVRDAAQNVLNGVSVTWSSSNGSVATVDPSGRALAVGNGSARLTAAVGSVSASATVTVQQVAVALTVSPTALSIPTASATTVSATLSDANGNAVAGASVSWSSGDQAIATVDVAGVVTGVAAGSTTITATSGALSADASVTVTAGPAPTVASVTITPSSGSLSAIDETIAFTAEARDSAQNVLPGEPITWASNDQGVVTVSQGGLVQAVANGATTITAASGAVSTSAPVTVQQKVASVVVAPASASVAVGGTTTFNATALDATGHPVPGAPVSWSSGNPGVATVDAVGIVTGVAAGSTTVTALSGGQSQSAAVTVTGGGRTILLQEQFEDANLGARGWYDNGGVQITTSQAHSGNSALQFHFPVGANVPTGIGMRHLFTETGSLYLSYWVKYSANWIGSGDPFDPHEFLFMTNQEGQFAGPSATHLTVYVEHNYQNGGIPRLTGQDALNIDIARVGQDLTGITENRAALGCNGTMGQASHTSCYPFGTEYRNAREWHASQPYFTNTPGPGYKNDWHFIEAYFQLNSIQGGIATNDGVVQYWFDGQLIIDRQDVLLRTGAHPGMRFNQMLITPWIGSGSPADQTMWIDDLTLATGR